MAPVFILGYAIDPVYLAVLLLVVPLSMYAIWGDFKVSKETNAMLMNLRRNTVINNLYIEYW